MGQLGLSTSLYSVDKFFSLETFLWEVEIAHRWWCPFVVLRINNPGKTPGLW